MAVVVLIPMFLFVELNKFVDVLLIRIMFKAVKAKVTRFLAVKFVMVVFETLAESFTSRLSIGDVALRGHKHVCGCSIINV